MKHSAAVLLLMGLSPIAIAEGSPWLPAHDNTTLSVDITTGATSDFFIGDDSVDLGGDLEGTFIWLNARYGYDDLWAFDFKSGYARSSFETNPTEQEAIADTSFGVSYQVINEFEADNGWPTLTVRAGLTIGGDYDTNIIEAIGDGASGLDLSLLAGKALTPTVAVAADLTYRQRGSEVANGVKYLFSAFYSTPINGLGLQAAAGGIRTNSDINIGDPDFGVDQFPQTDRDSDWLILGASHEFANGFGLGFSLASVLSGKNIADSNIGTFSLSYSF